MVVYPTELRMHIEFNYCIHYILSVAIVHVKYCVLVP